MLDFASILASKRKEMGLSQGELAKLLHVTRQAVSKWENGKGIPEISILTNISEVIGVSIDELLTGNEPEKQIVEKIIIQEKEVVKPMPARKILAIVAPIVLVVVLAASLMGVYIPKAIAANIPPITDTTEPTEPEIKYTEVYIKGKSNTNDSCFHSPLNGDKAYYTLTMQVSSDYTLYITAPAGAVATLNGEVIAEFDIAKTVEYTQYFNTLSYGKNEEFNISSINSYEYVIADGIHFDGNVGTYTNYILIIDMTNCSDEDKENERIGIFELQQVVIRQHYGFDDITIPANGTYFVAIRTQNEANAWHYAIRSEGIKYVESYILHSAHNYRLDYAGQSNPQRPISDFYIIDSNNHEPYGSDTDWQIGLVNLTDKDVKLEIEEIPIEEISLGQKVTVKSVGFCVIVQQVFKLRLDKEIWPMCEMPMGLYKGRVYLYDNRGSYHFNGYINQYDKEGWRGYYTYKPLKHEVSSEWIYVVVHQTEASESDITFILGDWNTY